MRSPSTFKVHFHKVGLDTYVQTPQLLTALEIPRSVNVLGHDIDLEPLR